MKVIWTEQALVRLAEIQDFIARANPDAAERSFAQQGDCELLGKAVFRLVTRNWGPD